MNFILAVYRTLFAYPFFERFNRLVMLLGLSGLGVLNYTSARASGELHFLRRLLGGKRAPVCLDIGANRGLYAQMILTFSPGAHVHCFEPHPRTFLALRESLSARRSVTLNNCGCGDCPGELALFDYSEADGSSHASMHREVIEQLHNARSVEHRVPVQTIDDYVLAHGLPHIDLLKIDTEGHEFAVLRGATRTLADGKIDCIHLEFNEMNAISGVFFKQVFDMLSPGFRIYRLLPTSMLEIRQYKPVYCEIFAFQNIVAVRRAESDVEAT